MTLHSHVNNSGFPLQIALANQIRGTDSEWSVLYQEHYWKTDTEEGFIDLALEHTSKQWVVNVECKRVRDADWIFLVPSESIRETSRASLWWSEMSDEGSYSKFGWHELLVAPLSYESSFCVVKGQDPKSRPMIERTAAQVANSSYGIAFQESRTLGLHHSGGNRIYLNAIVTTAKLQLCVYDPDAISLVTGEIDDTATFREVPFVRFRKQLGAPSSNDVKPCVDERALRKMIDESESTVFVINSEYFTQFLEDLDIQRPRTTHWR